MPGFVANRLLQSVIVLLVVGFFAFALSGFGDPVSGILGTDATPEARAQLAEQLMLDRSYPVCYAHYLLRSAAG